MSLSSPIEITIELNSYDDKVLPDDDYLENLRVVLSNYFKDDEDFEKAFNLSRKEISTTLNSLNSTSDNKQDSFINFDAVSKEGTIPVQVNFVNKVANSS